MGLEHLVLVKTNDFPIKHEGDVHNGKVRSVYWQSLQESRRLIEARSYPLHQDSELGVMIISDRISAFECNWQGEDGLGGIPGKGAALNAISLYWFKQFDKMGLAGHHVVDTPHPLVWIVQKAAPVKVEAIARQYLTGSLWRAYEAGEREFCGITLPEGLQKNQRLDELLLTPTTKGVIKGIPGVPEQDDVNVTKQQILDNYEAFGFLYPEDVDLVNVLCVKGFRCISTRLDAVNQVLVDDKKEFGYVLNEEGFYVLIYIDEVGTPDSSRYWDGLAYKNGEFVEKSKELFRQYLLERFDRDILLNKDRMPERVELARTQRVPVQVMMEVSETYRDLAEQITEQPVPKIENAREEILDSLAGYGLIR
jgi:phosphoribosylaminoimidazole-succinocarboxamide synthase